MAGTPENARIWSGADVYAGPVGTTAPTDLVTALNVAFDPLGLLGTEGLSESREMDSDDKYAWGGVLVRTRRSKHKRTFTIVALEDNPIVFGLVNPGSEIGAPAAGIVTKTIKTPIVDERAFVFEMTDGVTVTRRRVVPRGEITNVGDVTYNEDDLASVELTITVYPASDGTLYLDIDDAEAFQ